MSKRYEHPKTLEEISPDELSRLPPEDQKAVARFWFHQHYEDPAEHMPYVSEEGGYLWIWGGPYDAEEELVDEFSGVVPDHVIKELAAELTAESPQWAPGPKHEVLGDAYVDVLTSSVPLQTFEERMRTLKALMKFSEEPAIQQAQYQLILAAGVSALEAYMAERAVRGVRREEILHRLIEKHPKFKEHKISVSDVPKMAAGLEAYATNFLSRLVWHRLDEVKRIFGDAFEVELPSAERLEEVILLRHDIVHRAGRRADGSSIELKQEELVRDLEVIKKFVGDLEPQLPIDDDTELEFAPNIRDPQRG